MSTSLAPRFLSVVSLLLVFGSSSVLCFRPIPHGHVHLPASALSLRASIERISASLSSMISGAGTGHLLENPTILTNVEDHEADSLHGNARLQVQRLLLSQEDKGHQGLDSGQHTMSVQSHAVFQMLPKNSQPPPKGPSPGGNSDGNR